MQGKDPRNLEVPASGLGCMGLDHGHADQRDRRNAVRVSGEAAEQGPARFGTTETHRPFTDEDIAGEAL